MSKPAFRLRLPCIPYVPAIEGSLISSCSMHPPPGPCFIPPVPPPPPPSFGCYEVTANGSVTNSGTSFGLSASVEYPNRSETGLCQPVINIKLKLPNAGDRGGGGGGGSGGSSGSGGGGGGGTPNNTQFALLVDVVCDSDYCTITKYYKNFEYDRDTLIVYWVKK